jgi:antitoxin (DNA-binding transcriptional repressor) of toxin-antitoxin stability system
VTVTISQRELRNDNARVVDGVVAGEIYVVTRNGVPVAELRPLGRRQRHFVDKADLVEVLGVGPRVDGRLLRADLDAVIDQGL